MAGDNQQFLCKFDVFLSAQISQTQCFACCLRSVPGRYRSYSERGTEGEKQILALHLPRKEFIQENSDNPITSDPFGLPQRIDTH